MKRGEVIKSFDNDNTVEEQSDNTVEEDNDDTFEEESDNTLYNQSLFPMKMMMIEICIDEIILVSRLEGIG